ncbi:MAG: hypothetical protein O7C75_20530, partial [Verrucomicrobia bacterium]|nr:hypothetical protein [Verrucomicrobiota bacterium]
EVTNSDLLAISGFRLVIFNLPDDVTVNNATGTTEQDLYFIDWLQPVEPTQSVILTVEYLRPSGDLNFNPDCLLEFMTSPGPPRTGSFQLDHFSPLSGEFFLIEWTADIGRLYCVEWSEDMKNWIRSGEPIFAVTTNVQWIDDGPPKTPSLPLARPRRFYRIVEK